MIKKAVAYVRVSDIKQVTNGHGLDGQAYACQLYADQHGLQLERVFREEGITGETSNRPAIKDLITFLDTAKEPYVVILDHINRLSRDHDGYSDLTRAIKRSGSIYKYVKIDLDDSPEGQFLERILVAQATYDRQHNAIRTKSRMTARAKAGYYVAQPPYGYHFIKDAEHGRIIVPKDGEAEIISDALHRFADGRLISVTDFANFLSKRKGKKVGRSYAHKLLNMKLYSGIVDMPSLGVLVQGKHQPLISYQTFELIQQRLKAKQRLPYITKKQKYPLRGIICCPECKRPYTASASKGKNRYYDYYHCGYQSCSQYGKTIPQAKLENAFISLLSELAIPQPIIEIAKSMTTKLYNKRIKQQSLEQENIQKQEKDLRKEIDALIEKLTWVTTKEATQAIEHALQQKQLQLQLLNQNNPTDFSPSPKLGTLWQKIEPLLQSPDRLWIEADFKQKQNLPTLIFKGKLTYCRNEGFGTPETSAPFDLLSNCNEKDLMARPRGQTWNSLLDELSKICREMK